MFDRDSPFLFTSIKEMETVPAMAIDQTPSKVTMVVTEMKAFRKCFLETQSKGGRSDLKSFWLRKTKKPVLAVLLVQKPDGKLVLYRGTNMEVSMPTGSLCAERNVIGTALADNPGLKREDLLMVAVLSVQLPDFLPPPGPALCRPVTATLTERTDILPGVEGRLKQRQGQHGMRRTTSASSFASIAEDEQSEASQPTDYREGEVDGFRLSSPVLSPTLGSADKIPMHSISAEAAAITSLKASETPMPELNLSRLLETTPLNNVSGQSAPKRRIALYQKKSHNKIGGGVKKQKKSLLVQSLEVREHFTPPFLLLTLLVRPFYTLSHLMQDMNPLRPCGACNEWLKKIAESNPHFKVITFTDTKCNGVYVSSCQE